MSDDRLPDIDTAPIRWTFSDAVSPSPDAVAGLREAARDLERIASHISTIMYFQEPITPPHANDIRHDDYDRLREIAALLASDKPGLGVAWAEAEAALPEGWAIQMVWGTITEERWGTSAGPWPSKHGDRNAFGGGDTPAAALRALAARLREREA